MSTSYHIGIVRFYPLLDDYTKCLLKLAYAYNVSVCCYSIFDIDITCDDPDIPALLWNGEDYVSVTVKLPPIADCVYPLKAPSVLSKVGQDRADWLLSRTLQVENKGVSKHLLMKILMASPLAQYAIPTYDVQSPEQAVHFTKMFGKAILKPSGGHLGLGVYRMHCKDGLCQIDTADGIRTFDQAAWEDYCHLLKDNLLGMPILQPCLDFTLDQNHAVDFRLLTARSANGNWETVAIHAKIGATSLVANIARGGYYCDAMDVLPLIAGDRAQELMDQFIMLAREIPPLVQRYREMPIASLGIDVGIDRGSLQPFVVEANTYPGTQIHLWQLAECRAKYYIHLIAQHLS